MSYLRYVDPECEGECDPAGQTGGTGTTGVTGSAGLTGYTGASQSGVQRMCF